MTPVVKTLGIIPARYASSRLEGKALLKIGPKAMVMHVWERALAADVFDHLVVATDDKRIHELVESNGGEAVMTSGQHESGTSRCLETYDKLMQGGASGWDVVFNIQGDEPFLDPADLRKLKQVFDEGYKGIATLCTRVRAMQELQDPNVVKVVTGKDDKALYFSRAAIPFLRGVPISDWLNVHTYLKHIGIYAYSSIALRQICELPADPNEKAESLEQLRWLGAGHAVKLVRTENESFGVDTASDLEKARMLFEEKSE